MKKTKAKKTKRPVNGRPAGSRVFREGKKTWYAIEGGAGRADVLEMISVLVGIAGDATQDWYSEELEDALQEIYNEHAEVES